MSGNASLLKLRLKTYIFFLGFSKSQHSNFKEVS